MDYAGVYEDLLAIERRAKENGLEILAKECFAFRVEILLSRGYSPWGWVSYA